MREFLAAGISEVWVVYPRTRTVHRYTDSRAQVSTQGDVLSDVACLSEFTCPVAEFFE